MIFCLIFNLPNSPLKAQTTDIKDIENNNPTNPQTSPKFKNTFTPGECLEYQQECLCYKKESIDKIARAIVDLKLCQYSLKEREEYIKERYNTFNSSHGEAWWQQPEIVISGVVISFSLGALLTYGLAKR